MSLAFWTLLTFTFVSTQSGSTTPTISNATGDYYIGNKASKFASKLIACNPLKHCHILCNASDACASTKISCNSSLCDLQCLSSNSCFRAQFTVNSSTSSAVTVRCEAAYDNHSYAPCNDLQISANANPTNESSASFDAVYNSTQSASCNSTINVTNFNHVSIARYDCASCDHNSTSTHINAYNFTSIGDLQFYCDDGACANSDILAQSIANLSVHCNGSESCQNLTLRSVNHNNLTLNCSDINTCTQLNFSSSSSALSSGSNTQIFCTGVEDDNGMNYAFFTCYKSKITSIGGDSFMLLATSGHLSHSRVVVNDTRRLNLTCLQGCSKSRFSASRVNQTNVTFALVNEVSLEIENDIGNGGGGGGERQILNNNTSDMFGQVGLNATGSYNGQFQFSDLSDLWVTKVIGAENRFNLSNISRVEVAANSSELYAIYDAKFWMDAVGNVTFAAMAGKLELVDIFVSEVDNFLMTNDETSYFSGVNIVPVRVNGNFSVKCDSNLAKGKCQLNLAEGHIRDSLNLECTGSPSCGAGMQIQPAFVGNVFNVICVGNGSCDGLIDASHAQQLVMTSSATRKTLGVVSPRIITPKSNMTGNDHGNTTSVQLVCSDYGCFDLNVSTTNGVKDLRVEFEGKCKCHSVGECIDDWRVQCQSGEAHIQSGNCTGECCEGFEAVRNAFSDYYAYGCAPTPAPKITPKEIQLGLLIAVLVIVIIGLMAGCFFVYFGRKPSDEKQQIMLLHSDHEEPSPSIN